MAPCVFSALSCCVVFVTLVVTSVWGGVFIDGFGQWKVWGFQVKEGLVMAVEPNFDSRVRQPDLPGEPIRRTVHGILALKLMMMCTF